MLLALVEPLRPLVPIQSVVPVDGRPGVPSLDPGAEGRPPVPTLTAREREVLELLGEGLPNKLIARRLEISEKTVKSRLTSILRKLGFSNRTQAAAWALREGLVDASADRDASARLALGWGNWMSRVHR